MARAMLPKRNLVMRRCDDLGPLFYDGDFADLIRIQGRPVEAPTRLALVTLLQFMKALTDRQATAAVRTRMDWKRCAYSRWPRPIRVLITRCSANSSSAWLLSHQAEARLLEGS